jgi:phosphoribosylanthranilate isomerase
VAEAPEVKICGLVRRADAEGAASLGADYLGVVLSAGFRRSVAEAAAGPLLAGLAPVKVAVLVDEEPARAGELARAAGAGVIQLHGSELPEVVEELAAERTWRLWKSVRAREPDDVRRAVDRYGAWVDAILVEGRLEGVVGGGGARLSPERFGCLLELAPAPLRVVLAGGLTPDTVADAVDHFAPHVVDVSSGVEVEPGRKSLDLVARFIREARRAGGPGRGTGNPPGSGASA